MILSKIVKEKKCAVCPKKFTPYKPLQKVCSPACAIEFVRREQAKKEKKDWNAKKKIYIDKTKSPKDWKDDLQTLVNYIVRLIDHSQPCIATKSTKGKRNAGHYISVGSNSTLRYNLHNIHIQSEHSNTFKSGDTHRYQRGLIRIYGQDYFDFIEGLQATPSINLSVEDIKEKIPIARVIIKELKIHPKIYDAATRITLRNKYNAQLGIYNLSYIETQCKN